MTKVKLTAVLSALLAMLGATPSRAAVMTEAVSFLCGDEFDDQLRHLRFPAVLSSDSGAAL